MSAVRDEMIDNALNYEYPDCVLETPYFFALGVMDAALGSKRKMGEEVEQSFVSLMVWNDKARKAYIAGRGMTDQEAIEFGHWVFKMDEHYQFGIEEA